MKVFISLIIVILLLYAGGLSYLYIDSYNKNKGLSQRLDEAANLKKKLEEEITSRDSTSSTIKLENEQLRKDSLDYLKKQKESSDNLEKLKEQLEDNIQKVKLLEGQLKEATNKLAELEKQNTSLADINNLAVDIKVKKQQDVIAKLEGNLFNAKKQMARQEALLHYNLGVAYTKDKYYDMAIDEYKRALELNPDDPDIHYNLAIIYDDCQRNPKRAVEHYRRYLELKPDAPDIDQVKEWIARLEK